jgi:chemotaxis protein CheC
MNNAPLSAAQLRRMEIAFHRGAADATQAMATWLDVPSLIVSESLEQVPVPDAVQLLGTDQSTLAMCAMELSGGLSGLLALAFDDSCGLALSDLILKRAPGESTDWGELQQSAALESTNIIGCAFLNALAEQLVSDLPQFSTLLPSPPVFRRDFAECLLQSILMEQAIASDTVFLSKTSFEMQQQPLNWTLLLIPGAESMLQLCECLPND